MPEYEIIHSNSLSDLADRLKSYPSVFIIADRRVRDIAVRPIVDACEAEGVNVKAVKFIRACEYRKNLRAVQRLLEWLMESGADRDALVLAIGGGVTTDLAGFTALIYKRGIRYACVPTTLLAQVDAATGGKTGCNVCNYKNMAGLIRRSEFTFIDADFLKTLPRKQYLSGYAELVKTFIIADAALYRKAICGADDRSGLPQLVRAAVEIKTRIVGKDEQDRGERHLLNLGHTFAHAIEYKSSRGLFRKAVTGEKAIFGLTCGRMPHGLAVAAGIIMAAELSEKRGIAEKGLAKSMSEDFRRAGLPSLSPWPADVLEKVMRTDKKVEGGQMKYVLIREIGRCEIYSLPL